MSKIRKAAIVAASVSTSTVAACVLDHAVDLLLDSRILLLTAAVTTCCAVAIVCADVAIGAVQRAKAELIDCVTAETRAFHRLMVATMEQYGDNRAIDAVVASERRRAVNDRMGRETRDLANVTPLRKRS